ncbi:MAG: GNAT family N-acetyltransferase [Saprospiraceae bacterium]|nr:GNAT family N-acetyltransferase [Saprospiraceae bacterium]
MLYLPPYPDYPVLTGVRVLLRPLTAEDAEALLDISMYDGRKAETVAEAAQMLGKIHQDYLLGESIHWGIEDLQTGILTGTCGFYRGGFNKGAGELGCILLPDCQGKGYMSEAIALAAEFGREKMHLTRVYAITTRGNAPAIRLLERQGFEKTSEEGELLTYDQPKRHEPLSPKPSS